MQDFWEGGLGHSEREETEEERESLGPELHLSANGGKKTTWQKEEWGLAQKGLSHG